MNLAYFNPKATSTVQIYIFISLGVQIVGACADEVVVLYAGMEQIVEFGEDYYSDKLAKFHVNKLGAKQKANNSNQHQLGIALLTTV